MAWNGGRAEAVPLDRIGGVEVGARVDDERLPARRELERELVVVAVPAPAVAADVAAADDRVEALRDA